MNLPTRGEVWQVDLSPDKSGCDENCRMCLVISDDTFNKGCADVAAVLPLGPTDQGVALRVPVKPPEGGVEVTMFVMPEMIRTLSKDRLLKRLGEVSLLTMERVEHNVRVLLGL